MANNNGFKPFSDTVFAPRRYIFVVSFFLLRIKHCANGIFFKCVYISQNSIYLCSLRNFRNKGFKVTFTLAFILSKGDFIFYSRVFTLAQRPEVLRRMLSGYYTIYYYLLLSYWLFVSRTAAERGGEASSDIPGEL